MGTWVLILMVSGFNGVSTTQIEFPTELGCQEAGEKAINEFRDYRWNGRYICVEKK